MTSKWNDLIGKMSPERRARVAANVRHELLTMEKDMNQDHDSIRLYFRLYNKNYASAMRKYGMATLFFVLIGCAGIGGIVLLNR